MTSNIIIRDINDLPLRTPPIPGIPVKTLLDESNSRSMRAGMMSWSPGAKSATQPHQHSVEEFQLVLSGNAALIDRNGDAHRLRPGTMFLCPPGPDGIHAVHNSSDFAMTLLFVYPRQDFETTKSEVGQVKTFRSTILMREIEDIKAGATTVPGIRRKRLCGPGSSDLVVADVAWYEPGANLTGEQMHYHSSEEFQLVLYGRAELTDSDGKRHVLREGTMSVCPSGAGGAHGIQNTSDFPMSLLIVHPVHEYETHEYLIK
jgi:quercetin dioxygenase-like cupin family protein